MTVELIQGLLLAFALVVILMNPFLRLLGVLGLRKQHPARGTADPLRQGRHADDGRPAHRRGGPAIYVFLYQPDAATFAPLVTLAIVGLLGAFDD